LATVRQLSRGVNNVIILEKILKKRCCDGADIPQKFIAGRYFGKQRLEYR